MKQHLLSAADLTLEDATLVLDTAAELAAVAARSTVGKLPTLRGRTVVNLFFEDSTRTRTSFELAAKRLSADVINFAAKGSSVSKGETLKDTALTLEAMGAHAVVIRHSWSGAPVNLARYVRGSVVNAGDGTHEHPTQALLDCATIRKHKQRISGLTVAICGDIAHSRVARSNLYALTRLGAKVHLAAPRTMLPIGIEEMVDAESVQVFDRLAPAIEGADVVNMLRIQTERLDGAGPFPNTREYSRYFGLGMAAAAKLKSDAIVMHPGPINRGVELDPSVADGPRSVILDQVTYGVAVRMAVLYLLGGGAPDPA